MLFTLGMEPSSVFAETGEVVPFSVQAILPDNQVSGQTYFDIEMETGTTQDLEVRILNNSDEAIQVQISANTAASNSNGVVTYDGSITEFSEAMINSFSEIAEVKEDIVEIPANDEKIVTVIVSAPDESFDGRIIGGLHFKLLKDSGEEQTGVAISNEFAYVIGVNIVEEGNDMKVTPEVELREVTMIDFFGRPNILGAFENNTPTLISQLKFEASVYPLNQEEPVQSFVDEYYSIAPYNRVILPMLLEEGYLENGTYLYKAHAYNKEFDEMFEMEFTVSNSEE